MENEFISDLQRDGLVIIQKKTGFRFGTDAVLLSDFGKDIRSKRTLDLCTGSGIVPILLYAKTSAPYICGVEIQPDIADMAKRSVELNKIGDRVEIICEDLKKLSLPKHSFDLVTVNPPYMKSGNAITNSFDTKTVSRHEVMCNLDDVIKAGSEMLRDKGHFVMVHRPSRLADAICTMRKYGIEPKRLRMVHSTADKEPSLFLIDGAFHGGEELKILPPLIMTAEDGGESRELKEIYERQYRSE
ncbi:MAG: tRNA1(Val) (adenine(37)-N6)-methyltransferase [Clostridia bacterium]|nr:tRNA1(Val) (adenine(37)-N6)-methyltransferase [Clostridia bacterium]